MAINTNHHFAVQAVTEKPVAVFQIYPKTSKINILLHNNGEKVARAGEGGMKAGNVVKLFLWESDDRVTWTRINAANRPIGYTAEGEINGIAPGGHADFMVLSAKRYLMVTGYGVNGGSYVRADFQLRGDPYFGQLDIEMLGKSGYGYDMGSIVALTPGEPTIASFTASAPTSVNYASEDSPRGAGVGVYGITGQPWPAVE